MPTGKKGSEEDIGLARAIEEYHERERSQERRR